MKNFHQTIISFRRGNLPGNYKVYNAETKSNFLSSIRKYRISQDQYNKQFAEFEIACQYRIAGSRVQKDIVHKWSVWKRYSELDQFNNLLKKTLGWQMQGIEFAPSYTFSFNKLSSDFLEQRRYLNFLIESHLVCYYFLIGISSINTGKVLY